MKFSVETIDRKDYAAVRGIIADSYKNDGPNTDGDEVDMVDRLRSGEGYQSQFEVVAKDDNHQVIGHALMVPQRSDPQRTNFRLFRLSRSVF